MARNDHWRYLRPGLKPRTRVSLGNNEIKADVMDTIIAGQLQMSVDEFRAAMNGDIPERFTNPEFWSN